jgi:hypothetical protein
MNLTRDAATISRTTATTTTTTTTTTATTTTNANNTSTSTAKDTTAAATSPSDVRRLERVRHRQVVDALIVIKARMPLARVQAARERGGQFADQAVVGHA